MDHERAQDAQRNKGFSFWHRKPKDDSTAQHDNRPFRRVQSPLAPREWPSTSHKPKFGWRNQHSFSGDDWSLHKTGLGRERYHNYEPRAYISQRGHSKLKPYHFAARETEREAAQYKYREPTGAGSPPKPTNITRPVLPRPASSRDKDIFSPSSRNQSRERDHRGTKSKDKERSREREIPSTASQAASRDRAIQQKRREIDEVYNQECEMFGFVVKMLIGKDPSLEHPIQSSLQENLREIGKRCVQAMERFIEEYDSREPPH